MEIMALLYLRTWTTILITFFLFQELGINKIFADPFRNECSRKGKFSNKHKDYSLQNHVIQTVQVDRVTDCTITCLEHSSCKSYNFQENQGNLRNCELSDSTKSASSADFVPRPGYSYYDAGDTTQPGPNCQFSPCLNGGTCVEKCLPPGYYCVCSNIYSNYFGEHCEKNLPYPDSCNKVKELGFNTDGEYYLYLQRPTCSVPARVYCADMNSDNAVEYITLLAGRSVNYGFNNRITGSKRDKHGKTAFDKIRLKLPERNVDRSNRRFAVLVEGQVHQNYAQASDCNSASCRTSKRIGDTKADLTGTDFKFPSSIPYKHFSYPPCAKTLVSPYMSSDQKRWSVKCGGHCGGCYPTELILSVDGC